MGSAPSLPQQCVYDSDYPLAVQCWTNHSASLCLSFLPVIRVQHRAWHTGSTQCTVDTVATVIITPARMNPNLSLLSVTETPPPPQPLVTPPAWLWFITWLLNLEALIS